MTSDDHPRQDDHRFADRLRDLGDRFEDAAVEAELATGRREDSRAEARSHVLVRIGRMTLGFALVLVGIVLVPLPGPGWVIIAGGLVVLSRDFVWAERTLQAVRRRVPGIPEDGRIPGRSWAAMGMMGVAAAGASAWWYLLR